MHIIRNSALVAVAALAVGAFTLSACSGDDDDTTSTATASPGTTTTASPGATGTTSATTQPTNTATATPEPTVDPAAIEALVTYYRDLDGGDLAAAYALWADDGAASGMSLTDFTAEYDAVDGVSPIFDGAEVTADGVEVDGRVLQVYEMGDGTQAASKSTVKATLSDASGSWLISSIETSGVANITEAPVDVAASDDLLLSFYDAINAGDLPTAYTYWESIGGASGQEYPAFATGYEDTANVTVEIGEMTSDGAAGSIYATMPVVISSTATNGDVAVYCGKYVARESNVPPFGLLGWRFYSADIAAVTGATADDADHLLANDCTLS